MEGIRADPYIRHMTNTLPYEGQLTEEYNLINMDREQGNYTFLIIHVFL